MVYFFQFERSNFSFSFKNLPIFIFIVPPKVIPSHRFVEWVPIESKIEVFFPNFTSDIIFYKTCGVIIYKLFFFRHKTFK